MNDPQSTIDDFASRLTDLSLLTPLHTHHPLHVDNTLSVPKSRTKLSLPDLLHTILLSISHHALPLDPTLPILHTPHTVPLKRIRPSADAGALLPENVESFVTLPDHATPNIDDAPTPEPEQQGPATAIPSPFPGDDPFPPYLTLQLTHLKRVSHYNHTTLEITPTRTIAHPTPKFLDELFDHLNNPVTFRARFGCALRSAETVALLAGHKPARETVIPVGKNVFIHTRSAGRVGVANATRVEGILTRVCVGKAGDIRYRTISGMLLTAWLVCLGVIGIVTGAVVWVARGGVVLPALGGVQCVLLCTMLWLGVGSEFRRAVGALLGWRRWEGGEDVVRDCGIEGRDALVNALFRGDAVDEVVSGFGFGEGVRVREWKYDPRFGVFVGERCAFVVRGRRWFRVVKEAGKEAGFRLFPGGRRRAFVGVPVGVRVVDGGRKAEVV